MKSRERCRGAEEKQIKAAEDDIIIILRYKEDDNKRVGD